MNNRVAFYLRVKPGEVESLKFQKRLLERFVARYGQLSKASIEIYSDCCDSMFTLGPEYERLTQDIKAGKVDVVIVADVGRICRCGAELEAFLNLLEGRKLRFISIGDNLDLSDVLGPLSLEEEGAA